MKSASAVHLTPKKSTFRRALKFIPVLAAVLLATAGSARATTVGLDNTTGSFSLWDVFASTVFSGKSADSSSNTAFGATLSLNVTGGILSGSFGNGTADRIYENGNPGSLTISGFSLTSLTTLSLQLKYTDAAFTSSLGYFTAQLNGVSATPTLLGTTSESTSTGLTSFNVVQYTWTGLNISSGSNFTITASGPGDHISLDAVRVTETPQLAAVPEPGAIGLIGGSGLMFLMRRRRPQVSL